MKKILSVLLVFCLALPLCAGATRERIYDLTEETLDALHARYDELLEQTIPGLPYPECCANMSERDRLLYVLLTYDCYLRTSEGLCGFLLDEPEMLPGLYAGLRLIGYPKHAEFLQDWLADHSAVGSWHFHTVGAVNPSWAHRWYDFASFDVSLGDDGVQAVAMYTAHFIIEEEPLWREDFATPLTLSENVIFDIMTRMSDAPWPECAAALNEDERDLFLAWNFLINWECGGLCMWLANTEAAMLADTPAALARVDVKLVHRSQLELFLEETGLDLSDPAAIAPFHNRQTPADVIRLQNLYPFEKYDDALNLVDIAFPFRRTMNEFILQHPESFQ